MQRQCRNLTEADDGMAFRWSTKAWPVAPLPDLIKLITL